MRSKLPFDVLLVVAVILVALLMPAGIILMHWIRTGDALCTSCDKVAPDYWHQKPTTPTVPR